MSAKRSYSHPLLWSFVFIAFVVMIAFFFRYWYQVGAVVGAQHPRPTGEAGGGAEVPDHAALIVQLDESVMDIGRTVYEANCVQCHGTDGMMGANGARLFPQEEFKNGADPYGQYMTLVRGLGLMPAQPRLSPEEKYAVIHYIRENFLKEQNSSQYTPIDDDYLASGTWPVPGGGGSAEPTHDYGKNATKPLTVPVKAVSSRMVDRWQATEAQRWLEIVQASALSTVQRQQLSEQLSPFAAAHLLSALTNEDESVFVVAVGDYLPATALLSRDDILLIRNQLRSQIP